MSTTKNSSNSTAWASSADGDSPVEWRFESKEAKLSAVQYAIATCEFEQMVLDDDVKKKLMKYANGPELDLVDALFILRAPMQAPSVSQPKFRDLTMSEALEAYENRHVCARVLELCLEPPPGDLDYEHVKSINAYLFQDFPALWDRLDKRVWQRFLKLYEKRVEPGGTREVVDPEYAWMKNRVYPGITRLVPVYYSRMTRADVDKMRKTLSEANILKLSQLPFDQYQTAIIRVYRDLNFLHPFITGNSITFREYLRQLCLVAGYELSWHKIKNKYDMMAARDLANLAQARIYYEGFGDVENEVAQAESQLKFNEHLTFSQLVFTHKLIKETEKGRELRSRQVELNKLRGRLWPKRRAEFKEWEKEREAQIAELPVSRRLDPTLEFLVEAMERAKEWIRDDAGENR